MKTSNDKIKNIIAEKGLKVTPQRMIILEAIYSLRNHPTADNIIEYIRKTYPNIATGTVYKVLDTLLEKGIIKKVTTDNDVMRYDGILDKHHHLYCTESETIKDYNDKELDELLHKYFAKKGIPGFNIQEIVLQIKGKFKKN